MVKKEPQEFKKAFLEALPIKESEIISNWKGPLTQFTTTMRDFLPEIASILSLNLYNGDYYTIDAIFYEDKDVDHFSPDRTYAKYIAIALEHENRLSGTESEINKLQLFNVPLKVLITYASDDERDNYLSTYSNIIENADVFGDISTLRKQLVIFGSCDGNNTNWSFHVYNSGGFVTI